MTLIELVLLSLALSLDSLAVSVATGTTEPRKSIIKIASIFGLAFGMSHVIAVVLGWITGEKFITQISEVDHWIAFGLLAIIGGKMIFEALFREKKLDACSLYRLPILCIATSIDALGVGLSLSLAHEPILRSAIVIGSVVFTLSFIGVLGGRQLQKYLGRSAEFIGGIVLLGIGIQILVSHL